MTLRRQLPEYVRIEDLYDRPGRPYVGISKWGMMDIYSYIPTVDSHLSSHDIHIWNDTRQDFMPSVLSEDILAEMRYLPLGSLGHV